GPACIARPWKPPEPPWPPLRARMLGGAPPAPPPAALALAISADFAARPCISPANVLTDAARVSTVPETFAIPVDIASVAPDATSLTPVMPSASLSIFDVRLLKLLFACAVNDSLA